MIPAIGLGPLGASEWSIGGLGSAASVAGAAQATAAPGAAGANFGDALTNAVNSLESTQDAASQTAQQLATGQLSDPTKAITAVENASLSLDFAAGVRNQLDQAATTLFQTQM